MTVKSDAFPDTVSPPVRALLEEFYRLSNAASSHTQHKKDEQKLASLFTSDGVYEFAGRKNTGHDAIVAFRNDLFAHQEHRDHPVVKVFTFGSDDHELVALGEAEYRDSARGSQKEEWAGRYSVVKDADGQLKFKLVQIFISNTPIHE
ncbi:hypothetical protein QBC38DRAFT_522345 [Podospora fimiseda]|uniref:Uncharacterized protein n=1 Tax=Podospora fimiseda TaxID=252190 RepID=A0AAN6YNV6_9PEZI|nr:hypothetical protein QBC38DRAFT_522345 [Podospora fimiseda]